MEKSLLIFLGLFLCFSNLIFGAIADTVVADGGFPGRGEYKEWLRANKIYDLGTRQLEASSYDQAISLYQQAITIYRFDPDYYTNLGLAYKKKGDFRSAEQSYRSAISVNETWDAWANLANVLKKQKKLDEARSAYLKSLKLHPPVDVKQKIERDLGELSK